MRQRPVLSLTKPDETQIPRRSSYHLVPFDLAAHLCDPELTPAARATQREMAKRVEASLAELNEQDCEIIVMRHYEKLSNQEAAQCLELSEPAASMRYLRAIRRLKELLTE